MCVCLCFEYYVYVWYENSMIRVMIVLSCVLFLFTKHNMCVNVENSMNVKNHKWFLNAKESLFTLPLIHKHEIMYDYTWFEGDENECTIERKCFLFSIRLYFTLVSLSMFVG